VKSLQDKRGESSQAAANANSNENANNVGELTMQIGSGVIGDKSNE
jgi:hypothetical protein